MEERRVSTGGSFRVDASRTPGQDCPGDPSRLKFCERDVVGDQGGEDSKAPDPPADQVGVLPPKV